MFVSVGFSTYLVGIYLESFASALDATPGKIGWATTILVLMQAGLGPILGHAVDAGKGRLILTSGAVMLSSGLLLLSQVGTLLQAAFVCVILIATGAGMVGIVPAMAMVVQWFSRRRGLAVGISACGLTFGVVIVPPVAAWLIESLGWRGSLMALGAFIAVFLVPAAWLIAVNKPSDIGQCPDGDTHQPHETGLQSREPNLRFADLIRRRSFWLMAMAIGTMTFSGLLMITYLAPFARERGNVLPGPLAGYFYDSFGTYASAFSLLWWIVPGGIASALLLGYTSSQPGVKVATSPIL